MGEPSNAQVMSIGKSPFRIEQVAEIASPEFTGSSPNVNGKICGATEKMAGDTEMYICVCACVCTKEGISRFLVSSYDKGEGRGEEEGGRRDNRDRVFLLSFFLCLFFN